ncbi:MAG: hypothetical protein H8D82_01795 [Euryarchaeota archaeon]|nr:hypothetical protein [Euryarchaeota archaeon]
MARKATGKSGSGQKKRRRKKMKLTLRSKKMKGEQSYFDKIGWSTNTGGRVLGEETKPTQPEEVEHQCSMCGSMNRIPRPKSDKYKVRCALSECQHEDSVGI